MRDILRTVATAVIWVIFTMLMIALFSMASDAYATVYYFVAMAVTGALALLAFILTSHIWQRAEGTNRHTVTRKSKRGDLAARLERLAEEMDEDDLIELESLIRMREQERSG